MKLAIFTPAEADDVAAPVRGVYLHVHGGCFIFGDGGGMNDPRLQRIADTHGLAVVSVDYRLCPEHSHADAMTDCIVAARWLITNASAEFGTDLLLAGGESAGANLVLCALCALRDEASPPLPLPFRAVNLVYGWFDLSLSPSARAYGERRLMTTTKEYEYFAGLVCPEPAQRTQPSISPLYAELRGLPPALFSVGTEDALRDDTLFCHARYLAAGNQASIRVWPGGPHGIGHFGPHELTPLGRRCHAHIEAFLAQALEAPPA